MKTRLWQGVGVAGHQHRSGAPRRAARHVRGADRRGQAGRGRRTRRGQATSAARHEPGRGCDMVGQHLVEQLDQRWPSDASTDRRDHRRRRARQRRRRPPRPPSTAAPCVLLSRTNHRHLGRTPTDPTTRTTRAEYRDPPPGGTPKVQAPRTAEKARAMSEEFRAMRRPRRCRFTEALWR